MVEEEGGNPILNYFRNTETGKAAIEARIKELRTKLNEALTSEVKDIDLMRERVRRGAMENPTKEDVDQKLRAVRACLENPNIEEVAEGLELEVSKLKELQREGLLFLGTKIGAPNLSPIAVQKLLTKKDLEINE